jgi:cystathionine beta-synthase
MLIKYLIRALKEYWLEVNYFRKKKKYGDLRDIISRYYEYNEVVSVSLNDTLNTAYTIMKQNSFSQLPVIENSIVVGMVDESDILLSVYQSKDKFNAKVFTVMSKILVKTTPDCSIDELIDIFKQGYVAIIEDTSGCFYGIITQMDLINYLKNKVKYKSKHI